MLSEEKKKKKKGMCQEKLEVRRCPATTLSSEVSHMLLRD